MLKHYIRPWGRILGLDGAETHKVKRILVNPKEDSPYNIIITELKSDYLIRDRNDYHK